MTSKRKSLGIAIGGVGPDAGPNTNYVLHLDVRNRISRCLVNANRLIAYIRKRLALAMLNRYREAVTLLK